MARRRWRWCQRTDVPALAWAPCRGRGLGAGLDRRVGKPSPRRAPLDELQRMLKLYHEHYAGFVIRHFHDTLWRRHGYTLGYMITRVWPQKSGVVVVVAKRACLSPQAAASADGRHDAAPGCIDPRPGWRVCRRSTW